MYKLTESYAVTAVPSQILK